MNPPTVPTSFAPRPQSTMAHRQSRFEISGLFDLLAYLIFGAVVVLSVGLFLYDRVLVSTLISKNAELSKKEATIDQTTIESFVRLRDRLDSGQTLLDKHVSLSRFLSSFADAIPSGVQFINLRTSLDSSGSAHIEGTGVAKSFNTLAAASTAFSTSGHIKDVIFSNIRVNRDNSVSFVLSGMLDQRSITFSL